MQARLFPRHCEQSEAMTVKWQSITATVIPAKAGIQYAAAYRFFHQRLWDTGSPTGDGD
jgi:hypothetical protein